MADYLQAYAAKFDFPIRSGFRVDRLSKAGNRYILASQDRRIEADNVVVAMSSYQRPAVPEFAVCGPIAASAPGTPGPLSPVLTVNNPFGRQIQSRVLSRGGPLIRVKPRDVFVAGIERAPRVVGMSEGLPLLADQRVLTVSNVVWCTGFRPDFSWIDLSGFGSQEPWRHRGVIPSQPGLYFVGLHFSLRDVVVDDS